MSIDWRPVGELRAAPGAVYLFCLSGRVVLVGQVCENGVEIHIGNDNYAEMTEITHFAEINLPAGRAVAP